MTCIKLCILKDPKAVVNMDLLKAFGKEVNCIHRAGLGFAPDSNPGVHIFHTFGTSLILDMTVHTVAEIQLVLITA